MNVIKAIEAAKAGKVIRRKSMSQYELFWKNNRLFISILEGPEAGREAPLRSFFPAAVMATDWIAE